jgi:hypothetical protein
MAAQGIGQAVRETPAGVVGRLLALQAQDLPGAKWSVGVRGQPSSMAAVDAALRAGEVVRSWPLRGTLHLVPAEDLGWLLELTADRAIRSAATRRASLGLEEADLERARQAAIAALVGDRSLTRAELLAAFDAAGISPAGQRGYHLLGYLAQTGTLVLGAPRGAQQTFALLDEWVRAPRRLERDEALGELAFRYFRGHGPATVPDLARWSGLPLAEVRRGLAIGAGGLTVREIDGVAYHLAPEVLDRSAPTARVHLLSGFDEYLLGYVDRSFALAPADADAVVPGGNGLFRPTIVADGDVVGTWQRRVSDGDVVIEPRLFRPLPRRFHDPLEAAAAAYGAFIGRPARVSFEGEG